MVLYFQLSTLGSLWEAFGTQIINVLFYVPIMIPSLSQLGNMGIFATCQVPWTTKELDKYCNQTASSIYKS